MKLNLGCGLKPLDGAVNVDRFDSGCVDVVWDVDQFPWPWEDLSCAEVVASHLFEHVVDPLGFMAEAHRVLVVGGLLRIEVPHYLSQNAFTDPLHVRFCTEDTFRYWVPDTWLFYMGGSGYHRDCLFDEISNEVISGDLRVVLAKRAIE